MLQLDHGGVQMRRRRDLSISRHGCPGCRRISGTRGLRELRACHLHAQVSPNKEGWHSTSVDWALSFMSALEKPAVLEADYVRRLAGDYGPRHVTGGKGQLYYLRDNVAASDRGELIRRSSDTFVIRELFSFRLRFEMDESGRSTKIVGLNEWGGEI
jgi:hypothetical protein